MSESKIAPISLTERIEVLDVLRGLAICGILIGNMQWFSGYGMVPEAIAAQAPLADKVVHFLLHFFVEGKFYSIFSFLFGFGFALQIARAEERGDLTASLFKRRLFWLLVIGLLHAFLLWYGDILSVYALLGFLLVLFRKKTNEGLLKWALALIAAPIVTYTLMYIAFVSFAPPGIAAQVRDAQGDMWNSAVSTVSNGAYSQIFTQYNLNMLAGRWAGLVLQMRLPKILAMFLLGFYAYRRGFFQDLAGNSATIRKVLLYGIILGIAGNAAFAAVAHSEADFPPSLSGLAGVITYSFGVPAMALGIVALVATLWQKAALQKILSALAPVGRMALTNYLLQTIVCVTIFYGYGFGQFGKVGALSATLIALGIFAVQIVLSNIWLRYFAYGPMEWIWRQLTYRKRLNLRREHLA
jgi:uncharacterized protein